MSVKFQAGAGKFFQTLRKRVDEHFETQKISKKGNFGLYLKTAIMFAMYIVPYWQLLTGNYNDWQSI
ncbi:MAG: hypothetical protein SNJ77_11935, partial [Cytophagales bacterium]